MSTSIRGWEAVSPLGASGLTSRTQSDGSTPLPPLDGTHLWRQFAVIVQQRDPLGRFTFLLSHCYRRDDCLSAQEVGRIGSGYEQRQGQEGLLVTSSCVTLSAARQDAPRGAQWRRQRKGFVASPPSSVPSESHTKTYFEAEAEDCDITPHHRTVTGSAGHGWPVRRCRCPSGYRYSCRPRHNNREGAA